MKKVFVVCLFSFIFLLSNISKVYTEEELEKTSCLRMDEDYLFYANDTLDDLLKKGWKTRFPLKDNKREMTGTLLLKNSELNRNIIIETKSSEVSGWKTAPVSSFIIVLENNENITIQLPDGLDENMTYEDVKMNHIEIVREDAYMSVYGYRQEIIYKEDSYEDSYEVRLVFFDDKLYSVGMGRWSM